VLMLVGGAAGSPAGGLKLGTLAVLVAGTVAALRGRDGVVAFGRLLPQAVIRQAVGIVFAFAAVHFVVSMILLRMSNEPFIDVLYETSSAVGTVGWSTGITPDLSTAATVVVMVTILVGRFLPLLLVLQIARSRKAPVGAQLVDNVRLG
ncbi:MAG: TrkH family potassium uptake protein, partial [Dehalococcoidia bacterium]|nr:TrkH family potassium uptake protein [Dehalococcoidia bacterium]